MRENGPPPDPVRVAVLSSSTSDQLTDLIELFLFAAGVRASIYRAEYGVFRQEILDGASELHRFAPRFLELYADTCTVRTHPFAGIEILLRKLEARGIRWGVITNKAGFLAAPLMERLGYAARSSALVAGDTLPVRKQHPDPVLLACTQAGVDPARCAFVGDDPRDVQAGQAAGLYTIVAGWGYLDPADARGWGAEAYAEDAEQIARWFD